jgi:TatD DNase family protein
LCRLGGIVTFKNAAVVQETGRSLTPDGYMVETDCPYLAPVPFRAKTCEPAHVKLTAKKIAQLRGNSVDMLAACTEETVRKFFRL